MDGKSAAGVHAGVHEAGGGGEGVFLFDDFCEWAFFDWAFLNWGFIRSFSFTGYVGGGAVADDRQAVVGSEELKKAIVDAPDAGVFVVPDIQGTVVKGLTSKEVLDLVTTTILDLEVAPDLVVGEAGVQKGSDEAQVGHVR